MHQQQKRTDTQVLAKLSSVSWWLVAGDDGNGLILLLPIIQVEINFFFFGSKCEAKPNEKWIWNLCAFRYKLLKSEIKKKTRKKKKAKRIPADQLWLTVGFDSIYFCVVVPNDLTWWYVHIAHQWALVYELVNFRCAGIRISLFCTSKRCTRCVYYNFVRLAIQLRTFDSFVFVAAAAVTAASSIVRCICCSTVNILRKIVLICAAENSTNKIYLFFSHFGMCLINWGNTTSKSARQTITITNLFVNAFWRQGTFTIFRKRRSFRTQ